MFLWPKWISSHQKPQGGQSYHGPRRWRARNTWWTAPSLGSILYILSLKRKHCQMGSFVLRDNVIWGKCDLSRVFSASIIEKTCPSFAGAAKFGEALCCLQTHLSYQALIENVPSPLQIHSLPGASMATEDFWKVLNHTTGFETVLL